MSKVTPAISSKVEDVSTISKKFGKKTWIRKKNDNQHVGETVDENKTASKSDDIPNNSAVKSSQILNQKSLTKKNETKSKIQKLSASKSKLKMVKSTEVSSTEPESTVKISTFGENGPIKANGTNVGKPTKPCFSDSKPSQTLKNGAEQQNSDIPKKKKQKPKVKKPKSSKDVNESVLQEVQNNLEQSSLLMSTTNENPKEKKVDAKLLPKKPPKIRKCWYFETDGFCRFGKKCRYLHVTETNKEKSKQVESKSIKKKAEVILPSKPGKFDQIKPTKIILKIAEIGTTKQQEARNREIAYFQTRFDGTVVTEVLEGTQLKFQYTSTNPEWVFDVKTITMILELKSEHPVSNVKIEIEQAEMPGPLHQYLKKKLNEMFRTLYEDSVRCDSFDLIGKWFVRQLDQYLLEMFVIGLKRTQWLLNAEAAGIKVTIFDKPAEMEERKLTTIEVISKQEKQEVGISAAKEKEDNFPFPSGVNFDENSAELTGEKIVLSSQSSADSSAPAVKIQICVNWQDLEQTIGTISLIYFSGAARCLRCSNQEFFEVSDGKEKTWPCKKCSSKQSMNLESDIGHQNSNVLANCHPIGCRPVDLNLQSSKLKLTCFNCSKELIVEALPYGAPFMTWCRKCNMKLKFVVDSISFRGNFVAIPQGKLVKGAKAPKTKPLKNSLIITPGTPLPKNGTCNHYGKSFRWFRFPCCGKLYPCDLCHNEAETDHEMKLATRMICGFCSTEQPFSKDSCNICKGAVTKIRSTFWEGGKGCRDQKTMCKNDPRKYKNTSKTIPKKRTGQTSNKKNS